MGMWLVATATFFTAIPTTVSSDVESGNFGTSFFVFVGPGDLTGVESPEDFSGFRLAITPYDVRGAMVRFNCFRCGPLASWSDSVYIPYGDSHTISAPKGVFAKRSSDEEFRESLHINATLPVSVLVNSDYHAGAEDTFLALPENVLGNKYILNNYNQNGYVAIAAVHRSKPTKVFFHYRNMSVPKGAVDQPSCRYKGETVGPGGVISRTIERPKVWLIACDYLTGSFVHADRPVAVFVGNYEVSVAPSNQQAQTGPTTEGHLQEQVVPMAGCGMQFVTPGKIVGSVQRSPFLKVVACYSGVKLTYRRVERLLPALGDFYETDPDDHPAYVECTVGCLVTLFKPSSGRDGPSMAQLVSLRHFPSIYTFSTIKDKPPQQILTYVQSRQDLILVMILKEGNIANLCHNEHCGLSKDPNPWVKNDRDIDGTRWRVWTKLLKADADVQEHFIYLLDEKQRFGLYVYKVGEEEGSLSAAGINLVDQVCGTTLMTEFDEIDNDCDGNIDEETKNGEDDDFDGLIDEDVGLLKPDRVNGKWGQWTNWDCGISCGGRAIYRRFRLCNRPSPVGQGRECEGPDGEESGRICDYSNILCPKDCPATSWGPECLNFCPESCLDQKCDAETAHCLACPPGRVGFFCNYECPRFKFGANCSQSCADYCALSDCDPVSGMCDVGINLVPFILVCLGLSVLPAIFICAFVCWCRSRDPERVRLRKTIKKLDHQITRVKLISQARNLDNRELRRRSRSQKVARTYLSSANGAVKPEAVSESREVSQAARSSPDVRYAASGADFPRQLNKSQRPSSTSEHSV